MSPEPFSPVMADGPRGAGRGVGLFVAVVGPSGAGKDTLIRRAAAALGGDPGVVFARRIVTREADPEAEDHASLDLMAFEAREAAGRFCLAWGAHGLRYGLEQDLLAHIERGRLVVANLSRRAIGPAAVAFPRLAIAEITAPQAVLIERIVARGRETRPEAKARAGREAPIDVPDGLEAHRRIDNRGALDEATAAFLGFLAKCRETGLR
ncbi:MAG: phosphonate metabolism protein/1,5-bisphosphokinase (PRPP-forming) PhnN [Pseudomonadota bacterium]|nr:phosphonate metabolism protein/1,5-bisphosphokinase (PRPP-forming) PhnN [Pseudomonadota bacterium]